MFQENVLKEGGQWVVHLQQDLDVKGQTRPTIPGLVVQRQPGESVVTLKNVPENKKDKKIWKKFPKTCIEQQNN